MKKLFSLCTILLFSLSLAVAQMGLQVSISTTSSCNNDGTATASVTGGTAPYTFSWVVNGVTNANTTATLTNLGATNWLTGGLTVYVIDVNGLTGQGWGFVNEVVSIYLDSSLYALCPALTVPVSANVMGGTTLILTYGATAQQLLTL